MNPSPAWRLALTVFFLCLSASLMAQDQLAKAKQLYAAANYEEALALLDNEAADDAIEPAEYRILCLLALGRSGQAQIALDTLLLSHPRYTPDPARVSPGIRAQIEAARERIIQRRFAEARDSFNAREYRAAAVRFDRVVEQLSAVSDNPAFADLKMLAIGFRDLAKVNANSPYAAAPDPLAGASSVSPTAEGAAPPAPERPVAPPSEPTAAPASVREAAPSASPTADPTSPPPPVRGAAPPSGRADAPAEGPVGTGGASASVGRTAARLDDLSPAPIYDASAADVVPPAPLEPILPPVSPLRLPPQQQPGLLEIVVNEAGRVESAVLRRSISPKYDTLLLDDARTWRYRPATLAGKPVKFRKVIEIYTTPLSSIKRE
jgi:tetratricopeptide (TPR) repeat protein